MIENNNPVKRPRGRPIGTTAAPEALKQRLNVTLDAEHQEIARQVGDGNLSAGLRIALDFWEKKHKENSD